MLENFLNSALEAKMDDHLAGNRAEGLSGRIISLYARTEHPRHRQVRRGKLGKSHLRGNRQPHHGQGLARNSPWRELLAWRIDRPQELRSEGHSRCLC